LDPGRRLIAGVFAIERNSDVFDTALYHEHSGTGRKDSNANDLTVLSPAGEQRRFNHLALVSTIDDSLKRMPSVRTAPIPVPIAKRQRTQNADRTATDWQEVVCDATGCLQREQSTAFGRL